MERLAFALTFNVTAALVVVAIGAQLLRRPVHGPGRRAALLFSLWWIFLGIQTLLGVAVTLAGRAGYDALVGPLVYVQLVFIGGMLWGLLYYLAYLFTGRGSLFWPLTAAYAAITIGGLAFIATLHPVGYTPDAWGGAIRYENEPTRAGALGFWLFFLLPPIVGAALYGSLYGRVSSATHRYRIALVASGVFVWFTSNLVFTAGVGAGDVSAIGSRVVGGLAILALWLAYSPPTFVKRRLGVRSLSDEVALVPETEAEAARRVAQATRAARTAALARRASDLV